MEDADVAGTASFVRCAEPPRARVPWLVVESREACRVRLEERSTSVGRAHGCGLVIEDPFVSDRHFELLWEEGELVLRDLESRNGTYVNGLRVSTLHVGPGVVIQVGRTRLRCAVTPDAPNTRLSGRSSEVAEVKSRITRFSRLEASVLILGESGTGKELAARALHDGSPRREGPFVAVNCAGFSPELVDSELFGHERGAFTGACERRRGAFELADRGTLFLDELGDLPLAQQAKLLRVLERSEIRRVGGEEVIGCDARFVAATNADLDEAIRRGTFRADLFHRLAILQLRMPSLRARTSDLPELSERLLADLAPELGPHTLSAAALARLSQHPWPGNVRELKNVLYRAAASCAGSRIQAEELELPFVTTPRPGLAAWDANRDESVRRILTRHGGNLSAAARDLGVARSTLRSWLARSALYLATADDDDTAAASTDARTGA